MCKTYSIVPRNPRLYRQHRFYFGQEEPDPQIHFLSQTQEVEKMPSSPLYAKFLSGAKRYQSLHCIQRIN